MLSWRHRSLTSIILILHHDIRRADGVDLPNVCSLSLSKTANTTARPFFKLIYEKTVKQLPHRHGESRTSVALWRTTFA